MSSLSEHATGLLEVDGSTQFLLTIICGSAIWVIRNNVASVFTLLLVYPVAMLVSVVAYYTMMTLVIFDPKKMAEWLIWTIVSGTVGTFFAIGLAILLASFTDRNVSQTNH